MCKNKVHFLNVPNRSSDPHSLRLSGKASSQTEERRMKNVIKFIIRLIIF